MSLDEVRQYYPNITCIESGGSVQYVINNPDENGTQYESQQILLSPEQHIVLNTGENQQIIIDQSQLQYAPQGQQYIVQENDIVTDYQPTEIINNQQQIYYASPPKHVIQHQTPQTPILTQQIPTQQIINNTHRVVQQHVNQAVVKQMVPQQQVNNAHLMVQRRVAVPQTPQQVIAQQRPVQQPQQTVRLQYALQQPPQQPQQQQQDQTQQILQNGDDNHIILRDGRYMTLGQFKQELAKSQQENQQIVITHQGEQQNMEKPYKPPPKRNNKRNNRGGVGGAASPASGRGKGRAGLTPPQPQVNNMSPKPQPFQQVQQHVSPQPPLPQPSPKVMQYTAAKPKTPVMLQQPQPPPPPPPRPMMHPNIQQQQIRQQFQQQQNRAQSQPLIPLSPHVHNGHIPQQSPVYSPPNSQTYLDDSSSSMSDEYRDSARMLVCLENGEQRLITFTLPKESCTVQDLLEQVGVPFNSDTKIECISNPGSEIDYIVNVGTVNNPAFPIATMDGQKVLTIDGIQEPQDCIVSQTGAVIAVSEPPPPLPPKEPTPPPPPEPPVEEKPPEPPKILPKFIPGCLAVCNHCGYVSEDFNRCQRCKTRLPEDVKSIGVKSDRDDKKAAKDTSPKPQTPKPTTPPSGKPARTTGRKKKAVQEQEPVVLTLSSDEEDDVSKSISLPKIDNPITLSAFQKEPVISAKCDISIDMLEGVYGGGKDDLKFDSSVSVTTLPCRTVRIGSYRFVPRDHVSLTSAGVTIYVPVLGDTDEVFKLFIPTKYIIKVLGNFHKSLPVLFFYVTPSIGTLIRKNIKMEEGSEFYFDPLSKEDPFKRITLLPETVNEETKKIIQSIYFSTPYKMLEELTPKEANDILIRTCPREGAIPKPVQPQTVSFTELRQLLIYPPGKGGIAINAEDYLCLAQDQFLNDVIIDFYLKYLVTDVITPSMQEKVYIFSSFFYKRLTTKPAKASKRSNPYEVDPNLTPAEKRHCRVRSWTKNVNIFEKDYVIIPINESSHWFLAIICFPGLEGCRSMIDSSKVVKVQSKEKKKVNTITIGNTTITTLNKDDKSKLLEKTIKCDEEEGSDRDEADGDESELEDSENDSDQVDQPVEKKSSQREPIKQPCILIFDSLAGASRCRVVATLRDYLTCEHRAKLNSNKTFNKDNIKGACPKVPQQTNFTDCGLYVLQYVEQFFKEPITDFHIPIKMLKNWFEEIVVTRKREDISNLIKDLMSENNKDPSILPDIQFPTLNGLLVTNLPEQDFEDEEMEQDEDDDPGSSPEKPDNSLTQISTMYNHSDSSSESPAKLETSLNSALTSTSTFIVSSAAPKPDLSEIKTKSNRDTMSYLKSKRIIRHRNQETNDTNDSKKQKTEH